MLHDAAQENQIVCATLPNNSTISTLHGLLRVLTNFGIIVDSYTKNMESTRKWLATETASWVQEVPLEHNIAKQLALHAAGKVPEFIGGERSTPLARYWQSRWHLHAKNIAFSSDIATYGSGEALGWLSHPIEKPFFIVDIRSALEGASVRTRFENIDRILSGRRPKSYSLWLSGDTLMQQFLWGCILADVTSVYMAIVNNIDPSDQSLLAAIHPPHNS